MSGGEYGPARTPLHVGIYLIDGTTGQAVPYATAAAAVAAAAAGDILSLPPYAVAENLEVFDGLVIRLNGTTLGTAGDHSLTLPAPVGGESVRVCGWGTLEGTVGSLDAAAGAYFDLGPEVTIAGAVTGIYRVGRRWVLQSGEAIATYIPADGSVITDVATGDELVDGNTGAALRATTAAAATRWIGCKAYQKFDESGVITGNIGRRIGYSPSSYRKAWLVGFDGHRNSIAAPLGNYIDWDLTWLGVSLASGTTSGDTEDTWTRWNDSIDAILDFADLDARGDAVGNDCLYIGGTETGNASIRIAVCLVLCEVAD